MLRGLTSKSDELKNTLERQQTGSPCTDQRDRRYLGLLSQGVAGVQTANQNTRNQTPRRTMSASLQI